MRTGTRIFSGSCFRFNGVVEEDGDYRLCLDNTASRWSDKTVWFEVQVEDPEDDYEDDYIDADEWEDIKSHNEDTEGLFNMGVEEIKTSIHVVRLNINKMRHFFYMNAAHMSKVNEIKLFEIFSRNTIVRTPTKLMPILKGSTSGLLST